jgi:hypothetical protein
VGINGVTTATNKGETDGPQRGPRLRTKADEGGLGAFRLLGGFEVLSSEYPRPPSPPHETQELGYDDVVNRLAWDKETNANAAFDYRDIIAEDDRFALRFLYVADFVPTGAKIDVEMMYFYHLRGAKVAEFWLISITKLRLRAVLCPRTSKLRRIRLFHRR